MQTYAQLYQVDQSQLDPDQIPPENCKVYMPFRLGELGVVLIEKNAIKKIVRVYRINSSLLGVQSQEE